MGYRLSHTVVATDESLDVIVYRIKRHYDGGSCIPEIPEVPNPSLVIVPCSQNKSSLRIMSTNTGKLVSISTSRFT